VAACGRAVRPAGHGIGVRPEVPPARALRPPVLIRRRQAHQGPRPPRKQSPLPSSSTPSLISSLAVGVPLFLGRAGQGVSCAASCFLIWLSSRALIVIRKVGNNHYLLGALDRLCNWAYRSLIGVYLEPTLLSFVSGEAIARVN
jgi:hypothetical protein